MNQLEKISQQIDARSQPPVDTWKPKQLGEIDITIDSDGIWQHEGAPFKRLSLVRLFASILWFENDQYFLVTPAEKLRIKVADVPYVVQQVERVDGNWVATTNTQEQVIVSAAHPVQLRNYRGQLVPYLHVRYDLWARLNRACYLTWIEAAMAESDAEVEVLPQLCSGTYRFDVAG
ncbi:DUF1285 domain-containing protein [Arenicella xantha]|nr:DUF1285 domain-containing protein [Arenicella xantha]